MKAAAVKPDEIRAIVASLQARGEVRVNPTTLSANQYHYLKYRKGRRKK